MNDELYNYAAKADTIKIEDITSNQNIQNQTILRQLKDNDPDLEVIYLFDESFDPDEPENTHDYFHNKGDDIGWLGYYIGQCTTLRELKLSYDNNDINKFYREMRCNKSIKKIHFNGGCCVINSVEEQMALFFRNNHNLTTIYMVDCRMDAEGARQLALAVGGCSKSLKQISIIGTDWYEEDGSDGDIPQLANVFTAIGNHTQLEQLDLNNNSIGREESTALAFTIHCTTQLKTLNLYLNNIDDEVIEILVDSLSNCNQLRELNLSSNRSIRSSGLEEVATLLEMPDLKLEKLFLQDNNIGDAEALVLANALANNTTLKTLSLSNCHITNEGWAPFSKLLCDTSSVNNTYLSNYTLVHVGSHDCRILPDFVADVGTYLVKNRSSDDKRRVAMAKILLNYSHFNVQPFFEWELKVLPLMTVGLQWHLLLVLHLLE